MDIVKFPLDMVYLIYKGGAKIDDSNKGETVTTRA